jgi:uncharacterized membrane protein
MEFLGHFLLVGAIFAVIDSVWIGIVANKFYKAEMGGLLRDKPDFVPAIIFYFIYVFGLTFLIIDPELARGAFNSVVPRAAIFGLVAYATYDLTNASTLKNWSRKVTIVDMLWGTFVTTAVAGIAFQILR